MAEVRQIPGHVFAIPAVDGQEKQIPGKVFHVEEPAPAGGGPLLSVLRRRYEGY